MRNPLEIFKGSRMPVWNTADFDEMFDRAFQNPWSLLEDVRPVVNRDWFQPAVDVDEHDDAYLLSVDLPGVRKEDVKIDLNGNVLTVSGERKTEQERKTGQSRRYELSRGKFLRSFTLPATVDAANVEASMEDGVLRIAIPKAEAQKGRAIEVQSGKPSFLAKLIGTSAKEEKSESAKQSTSAH